MRTETLTFTGHGGAELAGRLDMPEGPVRATALFAHCFTCTKNILPARRIAARLTEAGIAVLRFDFTGLGDSEGDFAETTFASNIEDLHAAAEALAARDMEPSLMIGHSLGGTAVLKAAAARKAVKAVVTLGAPYAPDHVTRNFACRLTEIEKNGVAEVDIGGRPFTISKAFLDDIAEQELTGAIHRLGAALLVMHAPRDEVVGIRNATDIFTAALHPKSFVTLGDADHLISKAEDAEYAATVIAAWAGRYLGLDLELPSHAAMPVPGKAAPEGTVRVTELDPEGFVQEVANGPHHWFLSDEPLSVPLATNRGPNPYALLKAALGSCTSMTMRMYARVKKWPVTGISVEVTHRKVPAEDGATDDRGRPLKIDVFTRSITLDGDLDDDQRARLIEIADRCPVHRTLHQSSRIETLLAG
ncbi:bifunctional alpha/beta hydrolase/OsmC family protein [Sinisalibacter aestuarii]|uniref:Osmotically inducible protein C n=1 Tax=Sinisalibacter aestuarii TaxID=2949426 RepID=A0ABQ5LVL5_9RHOB|nr:bifunctional alpha/beta hydrolase/OsmC family protein [Sinisalibacter aestuarii]GKY89025.1 osmotically inducible protein C [Sinisalibacter aestuarii]